MKTLNNLVIDFETRSECDLKKCGGYIYASHPSTTILCMGFSYQGKKYLWKENESLPPELFKFIGECDFVVSHNYMFEYYIWNIVGKNKFLFPDIPFHKWDCTLSRACAYALPRGLEMLGGALGLPVEKDMKGNRVMLKLSKPRKPSKLNKDLYCNDPADFEILYNYCLKDIEVQTLVDEKLYTLSEKEKKVWALDFKINDRGIPVDIDSVKIALSYADRFSLEQNKLLSAITKGAISSSGQSAATLGYFYMHGFDDLSSLTASDVKKALESGENLPDNIKQILEIRQKLAKSSVRKLQAMLYRVADDGRIRGGLVYHGATTGRWAGAGIQIQNFPRPTIDEPEQVIEDLQLGFDAFYEKYPDMLGAISSALRYFIRAPEGKELVVSDFAAIEARAVFWLAESALGTMQLAQGRDIYKEMAARILKKPVEGITKDERQLGKQAILGAGFGMGASKFKITCEGYGMDISDDMAEKAVKAYRETYEDIPAFWYGVENAAVAAIKTGQLTTYKKVKFKVIGDYLFCQLPSGRKLSYYKPKLQKTATPWGAEKDQMTFMGVDSFTKKWTRQSTYGGKLVENITQAVARDIMVNSMENVEALGWHVIFTVHDELVCEVDKDSVTVEEFDKQMSAVPSWAIDLPLKVETYISKRYKK